MTDTKIESGKLLVEWYKENGATIFREIDSDEYAVPFLAKIIDELQCHVCKLERQTRSGQEP